MKYPILENRFYVKEGPQSVFEGNAAPFNIRVPMKDGTTPTLTSYTMTIYKVPSTTEQSATYLTGAMSVSDDIITTKSFQNLVAGDVLFVVIKASVNGGTAGAVACFHLHVLSLTGK